MKFYFKERISCALVAIVSEKMGEEPPLRFLDEIDVVFVCDRPQSVVGYNSVLHGQLLLHRPSCGRFVYGQQ